MTASEAINYIESCTWSSTRLGLGRTRELLSQLGDPQKKLRFIHVAGTNGKGSTCAMLASVMQQAGYRTALYTSPYICRFNERMQINGADIPDYRLAELTERIMPIAESMDDHPSQFELVTAIAMQYFLEEGCDIVVLEVGLGGALDSTNVIDCPECAVITTIGLEHTEYLGSTLPEIASAKAGIIKPGCDVVCYRNVPEVEAVFENSCREKNARLHKADFDSIRPISHSLSGQSFAWRKYTSLRLPLLGAHQLRNAAVALEALNVLRGKGWNISDEAIVSGLAATKWPVRFEVLREAPPVIIDGAHNPECARALEANLREYLPGQKCVFLMGVLADKDYRQMLGHLAPYAERFFCVTPPSPRALSANVLSETVRDMGIPAVSCGDIYKAAELALGCGAPVIACGSLYLAGTARAALLNIIRGENLPNEG